MILGPDAIQVGAWNVGKSNGKKKKDEEDDGGATGCWIRFRFISCLSSKSRVDGSISGSDTSTIYETKSTIDTRKDQPIVPVASSSTTSFAESSSSTPNVAEELKISSQLRKFYFNELKSATRGFKTERLPGEGGFGCVFKGWIIENGTAPAKAGVGILVAVKTLNHNGLRGHREWLAEVKYLGDLFYPHLVKLIGYCIEDEQRLLVYEFMPRGSLENLLFRSMWLRIHLAEVNVSPWITIMFAFKGKKENSNKGPRVCLWSLPLPWSVRMKIALGAAKGLAFLHKEAERPVIYRDFKTSNILLDADHNAKLSDFGLAKDGPEGYKTHVSTRVMGSYGYAGPEYVMMGHLTSKSDVYSFGVVLLEMLIGRRSMDKNRANGEQILVEWARPHLGDRQRFYQLLDPRLEGCFSIKGAQKALQLAARCLSRVQKARPLMNEVVEALKPLPDLKDMASSSSYFQAPQVEQGGSSADA